LHFNFIAILAFAVQITQKGISKDTSVTKKKKNLFGKKKKEDMGVNKAVSI